LQKAKVLLGTARRLILQGCDLGFRTHAVFKGAGFDPHLSRLRREEKLASFTNFVKDAAPQHRWRINWEDVQILRIGLLSSFELQ
jgi:hypothetical protein